MSTMNHNPVGWFEIYVQDMPRARAFYEGVFGVALQPLPSTTLEMLAFPMLDERPGCPGALVRYPEKSSGPGGTIIYFSCEDCAIQAERAASLGGAIVKPRFSIGPYGFIALVTDPDHNLIGLHSMH